MGREVAEEAPAWAVAAFGPVPADFAARKEWQRHAATVAAYRELRGHHDPAEALGAAPQPGQCEAYAAYRAAWRALGRPEIERDELEMSDGQLRMRARAYDRELPWAPRYVGNELAGTHQAAATHRQTAALRRAEAGATSNPAEQARLQREAADAAALAQVLDARAAELQALDDARARWLVHTAGTRAAAERAQSMLAERHADDTEPEQRVTAEEWLTAHRDANAEDEQYRAVTEDDVIDHPDDLARTHDEHDQPVDEPTELHERDLREVAAAEPRPVAEDVVRVPSADETSAAIEKANRALAEMRARDVVDTAEADEHRAEELNRWHAQDQATDQDTTDHTAVDDEPAFERSDAP